MKSKEQIGQYIKLLREENKMTQLDLANILIVEPQTISKWENGLGYPDITLLDKLSNYFEITVDDILECRVNENRIILSNKKLYFENACDIIYKILSLEYVIDTNDVIDFIPDHKKRQINIKTLNIIEIFNLIEGSLWKLSETNKFIEPRTGYEYDQSIFKEFLLLNLIVDDRFVQFLLDNFETTLSEKFIDAAIKNNSISKYFISYIGPIKEFYESENNPLLVQVPYKLHPQIHEMRDKCFSERNEDIFNGGYVGKCVEFLNVEITYNFEQFKSKFNSNCIIRQNNENYLSDYGNDIINKAHFDDLWKVYDYLIERYKIRGLKNKLLLYIEKLINANKEDILKNSIATFLKYWKLDQHELAEILYKTKDINLIKMFIDDLGIYPANMESLKNYTDQTPLDEQITLLFNKISNLENKINKLEDELKSLEKNI